MYLKFTHDIDNNVFSTKVTIDAFGTEQLSEDEEKELLNDFPTKIAFRNLTFSKNITISGTVPVITEDVVGDGVVKVTVPPLSNKEIILDENFEAVYKADINKIAGTAIDNTVLTTKELVAQSYCLIFDEVIRAEIENVMTQLRAKAPAFAGENIVSV